MILHQLRTHGIGIPFRSTEVTIDFDSLPSGLIALVGDNGSGKSHLLELSGPASLFRSFPSYGESLQDHVAPGVRDAFTELIFSLGEDRFRSLVQCDPSFGGGRGKSEAYLFRGDGEGWSPVAGPLVRDYDEAIGKILPSRELFLASVVACQGGAGSFFGLAKADRKTLFSSLLGLAHLQEKSEAARQRAQVVLQRLERAREDIALAEQRAERCAVLDEAIAMKRDALTALEKVAGEAQADLEKAQAALTKAKDALARAEAEAQATERDRQRLEAERDRAQQQVGALSARLSEIDAILAGADEVRAAAARLVDVDKALETARGREREASEKLRPLDSRLATLQAQRAKLVEDHRRVSGELEGAKAAATRAAEALGPEATLATAREEVSAAAEEIARLERELPALEVAARDEITVVARRAVLETRRQELQPRRGLLSQIPGVDACATCPLTADARDASAKLAAVEKELAGLSVVEGTPAQDRLRGTKERRDAVAGKRRAAEAEVSEATVKLERLARDREDAERGPALEAELARIAGEGAVVRQQLDEATAAAGDLADAKDRILHEAGKLGDERDALADMARSVETIAKADAQRSEVETALGTAKANALAARHALSELPVHDLTTFTTAEAQASVALGERARRVNETSSRASGVRDELSRLAGEREALGNPAAELEALRRTEEELVRDAGDWALLERALGRDGVQALAIDAAGPTVSALANDLLFACYGPRFSLSLETTALTKDGKKQREVFDIRILDAEAGREAKQGSGGEMIILDTALRLALGRFNAQRSGGRLETLWLDESTGALSPENAARYVTMLRRAMEIGGLSRCLLVAHQEDVWSQADARLFIQDGAVAAEGDLDRAA